jgi:hypothetical protein
MAATCIESWLLSLALSLYTSFFNMCFSCSQSEEGTTVWYFYVSGFWSAFSLEGRTLKMKLMVHTVSANILQGEHKNTPWFQVVIKSKLTGIFLQNLWLQMHKLYVNIYILTYLLFNIFKTYSSKFWFYNYLQSRSGFVFILYINIILTQSLIVTTEHSLRNILW